MMENQQRWIVKVGSAVLTQNGLSLSDSVVANLAEQLAYLRKNGVEVVLVSSGSIAAGLGRLGRTTRPERLDELQAAAAVGQAALIQAYDDAFSAHGIAIAQVLLTHADIANRERYLNARNTLRNLLGMGVLAIVNENDTVATEEICFGDNDNLAALVANLTDADRLVLLTDQAGLYRDNPRLNPDAELVREAVAGAPELMAMAGGGSTLGRGGMVTKLSAAEKASLSGATTVITDGRDDDVLVKLFEGDNRGTTLTPKRRVPSRKQWVGGQMRHEGELVLDAGAAAVLLNQGRSLLPVGVMAVSGEFERGALLSCVDSQGLEIARGLTNYGSDEVAKLIGVRSDRIAEVLGYGGDHELIHRNNMVVLGVS
jgi:glutamate 5-kinase